MVSERIRFAVLLVLAVGLVPGALADTLYRYKKADGSTVLSTLLPAEHAPYGYEVLDDQGDVIKVVPRMLTEEERANVSLQRRLEEEAREEQERLQKWDESLLIKYSSIADIEAARERSLRELQIRVSILKSSRLSQRQKVEAAQARVAEAERSGREPSEIDLAEIEHLKGEIAYSERSIDDRNAEIDAVYNEFQRDIDRFEQLQEVVELRRSLEAPRR